MGMVALKCPGCGADIELDNSREFGFCNYCGTKVMQDKIVVEHQGSVRIDDSENVKQYLQNARKCREREDWEGAKNYYDLVLKNEPTNFYAAFFSAYANVRISLFSSDIFKRKAAFNVLKKSISTIKEYYDVNDDLEYSLKIADISDALLDMYGSEFVYNQTKNGYGNVVSSDKGETQLLFYETAASFAVNMNLADFRIPDELKEKRLFYYKIKLIHLEYLRQTGLADSPENVKNMMNKCLENIKEIDPEYEFPLFEESETESKTTTSNSGGCYVATAVYGSYDCPQVWTLRRYRDNVLSKSLYGRVFIHTYYAISPIIVKWFGNTEWFKRMWQNKLDKIVEKLQLKGFESTPYEDLNW